MGDHDQSEIERPKPTYQPYNQTENDIVIERHPDLEATELENLTTDPSSTHLQDQPVSTGDSDGSAKKPSNQSIPLRRAVTTESRRSDNWLKKFWRHHVRISVYHEDCRDHFALERTFLGYVRTSVSLAMLGVVVAQLFRLQHNPDSVNDFGFYEAGRPLALLLVTSAIFVTFLGGVRFYRLQNALVRGKIRASGWEIYVLTGLIVGLSAAMMGIILRVRIDGPGKKMTLDGHN